MIGFLDAYHAEHPVPKFGDDAIATLLGRLPVWLDPIGFTNGALYPRLVHRVFL
jgi:hypothetical protein